MNCAAMTIDPPARRAPVTRDRILRAAIDLADQGGLDAISMRKLGQALGVEAMSLYKHVSNKDEVLDGVADLIAGEFEVPDPALPWKEAIRRSEISTHEVLLRHSWASTLIESRNTAGPARMRYLDAVIGTLRSAGFPMPIVARAFGALDSHTYGFTLQEQAWAIEPVETPEAAAAMVAMLPEGAFPNLEAMGRMAMELDDGVPVDFEFGLDLLLDGLERLLPAR
jgi:AcrR family transcriptional regulator